MLARTLAATGLALALALTAAKPGQAEVVCDTESAEDGACDPGTAAKTVADGAEAPAVSAGDLPVDAIRQIIREYLIEHPEVLIEAQQALQAKRVAREAEQAKEAIQRYRDEIFFDPEAPVAGNPTVRSRWSSSSTIAAATAGASGRPWRPCWRRTTICASSTRSSRFWGRNRRWRRTRLWRRETRVTMRRFTGR